jgi:hypothetical protein
MVSANRSAAFPYRYPVLASIFGSGLPSGFAPGRHEIVLQVAEGSSSQVTSLDGASTRVSSSVYRQRESRRRQALSFTACGMAKSLRYQSVVDVAQVLRQVGVLPSE